jgi:hypothetical protein
MDDNVVSPNDRFRDEDESIEHYDPPPKMQQAANMLPVDSFNDRRSITFITSLNGSVTGPRDFVYYDTALHTDMPALATNSIRLCTEPNDLPSGTDTLTYPGYHQQISSVSGLHASIIEDRSPLLAAAFEDSRSGRRLHLETLSSNTVMPFLRFLYTGSYAAVGDWQDVPTSVLLHCKMYWLGDLYDLGELKSQAYLNVLRQFEFGCSSPEKPIDLCSAIDFVYKTLAGHDAISDAIVQYCVTQCLSHKLHMDPEFKGLAYNVRAFHQDLTRVCRDRGYEDESSAIIIRLPYKQFAPDTYASMENPPIAGFHDIIHHFHSSDRFDEERTTKPRKKLTLRKEQATLSEDPQVSKQPASVASCTNLGHASPPKPAVALPIRQANMFSQAPTFASCEQNTSMFSDTKLPLRQLDDSLTRLSTALPTPGSGFRRRVNASIVPKPDPNEGPSSTTKENGRLFSSEKSLATARFRERRSRNEQDLKGGTGRSDTTDASQRRHNRGSLEARPAQYNYKGYYPAYTPHNFDATPTTIEDPFADFEFPIASPPELQQGSNETQSTSSNLAEHAKEIKRRKVESQDRKDFDSSHPWGRPVFMQLQSRPAMAPPFLPSWNLNDGNPHAVNPQTAKVTDASRFTPSNVSPTLPPTVFGTLRSSTSPPLTDLGSKIAAENISKPIKATNACNLQPMPSSSQIQPAPGTGYVANKMNPAMHITTPAAVAGPAHPNSGNHALQDYQMQLMLLEQQNKKRLIFARQEQDKSAGFSTPPPPPPSPPIADCNTKVGSGITVTTDVTTEEHRCVPDVLHQFDFDAFLRSEEPLAPSAPRVRDYVSFAGPGRAYDVLDSFDFDAFLKTNDCPTPSAEHIEDARAEGLEMDGLRPQPLTALYATECFSRVYIPAAKNDMLAVQSSTILPISARKWYDAPVSDLRCGLADLSPSDGPLLDGPLIQAMDKTSGPTAASSSHYPCVAGPLTNSIAHAARAASDSEVDMCDDDSDSDMSWVDVPIAEPKAPISTGLAETTGAPPSTGSSPARAGAKRRSSSSDSEWDFC